MQCLILSSRLKDYGHLLALVSYRKAPFGVEHAFCLTPTDEDSHSATIVVLCFAIVCVWDRDIELRAPKHSHSLVLNLLNVCVCPLQALGLALCAAAEGWRPS